MKRNSFHAVFFLLLAVLLYLPLLLPAQEEKKYPRNYFRWPLDIKPQIVANMGELRSNHWHMGLDIRTNQKENLPVYAAAAGYISKIRVEKFGFGQCIFITHPNGFTTLYGHLNKFFPALDAYVKQQQYIQETWAIELSFPKDKFPVTRGQFIAYSGNTGGSQGPHVHFEIRDTRTDACLNPLLFGLPLQDNVRPTLLKLAMYDRGGSIYEEATQFFPLKYTESGYIVAKLPVIKTGSKKISFGLQAFDRISNSRSENGIYSARMVVDGQPVISFVLDSISYESTRYLNAHIDYKYRFNGGPYFQHISQLPGERSGVYYPVSGNGIVTLADTDVHSIRIEVRDAYGNTSQLNFLIQHDDDLARPAIFTSTAQKLFPGVVNVMEKTDFQAYFPANSLYDTLTSFYNRTVSTAANSVSAIYQVNDPSIPLQGEITVRIKPDKPIAAVYTDRIVIQRTYRNSTSVRKAEWNGDWLTAQFGDFGSFQALIDDEPPVINSIGRGDTVDLSPSSRIVFDPQDNFDVIRSFRAELDGKWLRFTNDKGRFYIYNFDGHCPMGLHQLKVTVADLAGNETIRTWWFKKYPYKPPKKAVGKGKAKKKSTTTKKKSVSKKR